MNISEKIEEIRKQPEHVRMRYVWMCVAVSMFVVLIFWFFSIASMFAEGQNKSNQNTAETTPSITDQLQTLKEQAPSLKDLGSQPLPANGENTVVAPQNTTDFQYPANDTMPSSEPQSNTYSNLPNVNSSQ